MKLGELYAKYNRYRMEKQIGLRIRNGIHRTASVIQPYAKIVLPNFRAAHYFYIISMVLFGSFLVYPVRNIKYVDTLFFTGGASTQAGLNTVDTNLLKLYQQIVIYIVTTLTTPIFIHGSLLFIRLYWFERHFDNIKESSKLNFKMRRSATMAKARTKSFDSTYLNTANNRGLGLNNLDNDLNPRSSNTHNVPNNKEDDINVNLQSPQSSSSTKPSDNNVLHVSEPSDSEHEGPTRRGAPDSGDEQVIPSQIPPASTDIRFGNLPQPPTKKRVRAQEIDPSDMYRSIAMLRDNHEATGHNPTTIQFSNDVHDKHNNQPADDDEVLIIKSPNEIENDDSHKPIFTRKHRRRSSNNLTSPSKLIDGAKKQTWKLVSSKRGDQWSRKLRKSISNSNNHLRGHHEKRHSAMETTDDEALVDDEDDEDVSDVSIDSETNPMTNDEDNMGDDERDGEADGDEDEDDDLDDDDPKSTHSAKKNSVDGKTPFFRSPTFEKQKRIKRKVNKTLKRMITPYKSMSRGYIGDTSDTRVPDDGDEEDGDDEFDGDSLRKVMSTNYLSWVPTVGRNSTFVHLSEEQKEELGGVEYRAVKLLIKILLCYYIGFHILAFTMLLPYILYKPQYIAILREQGISPTWWAFFTASSAFNDLGITLTADSMISFDRSIYVAVVVAFFVVIGNTGFPVFLRFIIWILFKFAKPLSLFKESLGFLLDHPRRCFTLLFPSVPTWWLFTILVVLNAVDLILFIVLDLNNKYLASTPVGFRIMQGLFQAFSTRTAGFTIVDLSELHPAVQVSYMIMMYISVLPLAISIRRTNVYEEQSLGIYLKDESNDEDLDKKPKTFVGAHLRNQLSFDLWFIFLGLFIICICETSKLEQNNVRFSVFSVLFEIISAYGTVGLSLGYPGVNASLSSQFTTISKLVIIAMMIRGRHRGLPYSLDRAIMLPDDHMNRRDQVQESHAIRAHNTMERSMTLGRSSTVDAGNDHNFLRRARSILDTGPFSRRRSSTAGWTFNPKHDRRGSDPRRGSDSASRKGSAIPRRGSESHIAGSGHALHSQGANRHSVHHGSDLESGDISNLQVSRSAPYESHEMRDLGEGPRITDEDIALR